jgi:hypothetical protein
VRSIQPYWDAASPSGVYRVAVVRPLRFGATAGENGISASSAAM